MGMFDTVLIADMSILPRVDCKEDSISLQDAKRTGFQTKSMECNLDEFLIKDNKLYWRQFDTEEPYEPIKYTGAIHFYFPQYTAVFRDGILEDIEYHSANRF